MLEAELAGWPYVKSAYSKALMAKIGRTHRSVEFKPQNISAVLDKLGIPWIPGHIPKRNYQNAIFDAIDRYLTGHLVAFEHTLESRAWRRRPQRFLSMPRSSQLIRRQCQLVFVDSFKSSIRSSAITTIAHWGKAGDAFILDIERRQLTEADPADLARKVRWVAAEDGDGAGFDILSFDQSGCSRLIEVKTTNGSARTSFYVSPQ
jgi:hypothetical protein